MEKEKIVIGSDHAGYRLKEVIKKYLNETGYDYEDIGMYDEEASDYPQIAHKLAKLVSTSQYKRGILICGTGVGMCICANKTKGIRAVVCSDTTSAKFSRAHNDTNVLCLGQRIIGEYTAKEICKVWLETEFEARRHSKRVLMIEP